MEELHGFYRGIVAQNNDPERLGRVKVFVPHLHMALLDIEESDYDGEFFFAEFGTNYQSKGKKMIDMTKYIEKIKLKLPWAEISLPITGGGYSSFNSPSNRASTSDAPNYLNQQAEEDGSTGAPAGAELKMNPPSDRFASSSDNPNPLGASYQTQSYYNAPKGMFGIPQVNSKVWLFFLNGNPNTPIVFGYSPSADSYNQIFDDTNYPNGYENNDPTNEENPENLKRRQLTALNYKGGSISFNGTDNEESLSMSHDSGSYTEMNHSGKKTLVMGLNNKLVKGPEYTTIEDSYNLSCREDSTVEIAGDMKIQIGSANYAAAQKWKDSASSIHAVKSLPETQNADNESFFSSPLAKKGGKNSPCPACSQGKKFKTLLGGNGDDKNKSKIDSGQTTFKDTLLKSFLKFLGIKTELKIEDAKDDQYPKTSNCPVCKGSGTSPSTMGGKFPAEKRKDEIGNLYLNSAKDFFDAENEMGNGGSLSLNITKDLFVSVGCASNDFDSIRVNKKGASHDIRVNLDGEKGLYPSQVVSSVVEKVHVDKFPGGQFTIDAQNGINLIGGSGGLDLNSTGCLSLYGTVAEITGEQLNLSSKSGLNIATGEVITIKAPNIAIEAGDQTFIKGSVGLDGNMACRGGAMFGGEVFLQHVTAPMEIQETEFQSELYGTAYPHKQLKVGFIKATQVINVSVSLNLTGQTATIPGVGSGPVTGTATGTGTITVTQTVPIYSMDAGNIADDGCIFVYPHQHLFRNLPLNLETKYEQVRTKASGVDSKNPLESQKIQNGLKCKEVKGTTKEAMVGLDNQLKSQKFTPVSI